MYATNFEYDGMKLSDFGMMICSFDSSGNETVSSGADITFNTVKATGSNRFKYYGSKYEEAYTTTFQICKNPCLATNDEIYLEANEVSGIQRWLCRKDGFYRFSVIQDDLKDTFWNATFSSKQILISGKVAGLELTMYTDAPYAYLNIDSIMYSPTPGTDFSLYDMSDEVGSIYPKVTIQCIDSGIIELKNDMEINKNRCTRLSVVKDETIILDGESKIITSDMRNQEVLASSFNFYFPRIINTFNNRENKFTLSSDSVGCDITFSYNPIVKVGL
jgi:hypothetical protein